MSETPLMFLVEIEAGREEMYQSVKALAAAIHRGEVGPQSRIFHRASSSWISITLHPEFKKATAMRNNEPLPPLSRSQWTFFGVEPKGREIEEAPATAGDAGLTPGDSSESRSGLRRLLRRALRGLSPAPGASETSGSQPAPRRR